MALGGNPIATVVFSVIFAIGFFHVVEMPIVTSLTLDVAADR